MLNVHRPPRGTLSPLDPPAQGSETLENPALAAHFMRRGNGDDGLSFLLGANPAGRRRDLLSGDGGFGETPRGTLSPLDPPAQGSQTLENPTLAAHFMRRGGGDDGLAFLPRANPAGRRRDLLEEVGGFGETPRGTLSPLEPPAQGSETLENPALAAHFMRRGNGDDGLSFLLGANPAGQRRDLLGGDGGFGEGEAARETYKESAQG